MRGFIAVLLAAAVAAGTQDGLAVDLVVNGSFEAPIAPNASYVSQIPVGWSALGNGSTVDIISAGYYGGTASSGNQFVDLIGGQPSPPFPSGLFQTVHLTGGMGYRLSFDYNGTRYADGSSTSGADLEYSLGTFVSGSTNVDALNAFANSGPVTPWQSASFDFAVTTTGDYDLKFQTPRGFWASPYVDNVAVTPIPEPSTLVLLGMGAIGMLGWAWRRRRS